MIDCDVLVVGGGPAGSSLSIHLARLDLKVIILEKLKHNRFKVGEGLIPAANDFIKKIDAWDILSNDGHLPSYRNAWSWGNPLLNFNDYIHSRQGHGWHLDRREFEEQLLRKAQEGGVKLMQGYLLKNFTYIERFRWKVDLRKSDKYLSINTRFLADCSGRLSVVTKRLGIKRIKSDKLIALWAIFSPLEGKRDNDATTLVESEKDGWWHISLLPSGNKIVTFFTDNNHPDIQKIKSKSYFLNKLSNTVHIKKKLHNYNWDSPLKPQGESAESSRLEQFSGSDWIAVGDAAMTFDPLSSQGITNALYTSQESAKVIGGLLSGNDVLTQTYEENMDAIWSRYILRIKDLYNAEQRWANGFFWKNRSEKTL